jgi:ornithine cyclodeaminase/alanine dehydrogenase-like protein (mu-crystallin family)
MCSVLSETTKFKRHKGMINRAIWEIRSVVAQHKGLIQIEDLVELEEFIAGIKPARRDDSQITVPRQMRPQL